MQTFDEREINGGLVERTAGWRLTLPVVEAGYANAQLDDYGGKNGRFSYPWHPGLTLSLHARFSHPAGHLRGTAGFGFWNAPFGDPNQRWSALPQATWFFYGSPPNDLPLAPEGAGCGWFAATLDATRPRAWGLAPLAPAVLLLNRWLAVRRRIWPWVQRQLGISYAQLTLPMEQWHHYSLQWQAAGCTFAVDGVPVLQTTQSPQGPLGFVCWLDNQFLVVTPNGRLRWGVLPIIQPQWLEIEQLHIAAMSGKK